MADRSPKLALPFLAAAQAQKEITHNEALIALDAYVQLTIEDRDLDSPPASPDEGGIWLIASPASGDWSGQEGRLAQFVGGAWRFYAAFPGLGAWLKDEATMLRYDGSQWLEGGPAALAPPAPAISEPSGGATVDAEARAVLAALIQGLRGQGLLSP